MLFVAGDDALAVAASVTADMTDGGFKGRHCLDRHGIIHELSTETVGGGWGEQGCRIVALQSCEGVFVGLYPDVLDAQWGTQCRQVGQSGVVNHKTVERIAYTYAPCLGILNDVAAHL